MGFSFLLVVWVLLCGSRCSAESLFSDGYALIKGQNFVGSPQKPWFVACLFGEAKDCRGGVSEEGSHVSPSFRDTVL